MDYGIDTTLVHLDQTHDPSVDQDPNPSGKDPRRYVIKVTEELADWNGNLPPAFAGRNFLGGDFVWGHGEATNALYKDAAGVLQVLVNLIAPIQAPQWYSSTASGASELREEMQGPKGYNYGKEDAAAICRKLATTVIMGQFELPASKAVCIYLQVGLYGDTAISTAYWAGWADTVMNYQFSYTDLSKNNHTVSPFWPCIQCLFDTSKTPYTLSLDVKTCLDKVYLDYPHARSHCWAFWAVAPDPALAGSKPSLMEAKKLDWTKFESCGQPTGADPLSTRLSVPVPLWRYADPPRLPDGKIDPSYANTLDPKPPQGPPLYLNACNGDWAANSMLVTQEWQVTCQRRGYTILAHNFQPVGLDTNSNIANTLTPASCFQNYPIAFGGLRQTFEPSFVVRYYSMVSPPPKRLTPVEAATISNAQLPIVAVFEDGPSNDKNHAPPHWTDLRDEIAGTVIYFTYQRGRTQAADAFKYAAKQIGQPPHTPIYFAIDYDVAMDETRRREILNYFTGVKEGYYDYLDAHWNAVPIAIPYAIGVYAPYNVLTWCFEQGITSYYWQVNSFGNHDNLNAWPHDNLFQVGPDQAYPDPMYGGYDGHGIWQGVAPERCYIHDKMDPDVSWGDEGSWLLS
jgi:hypothetical protein